MHFSYVCRINGLNKQQNKESVSDTYNVRLVSLLLFLFATDCFPIPTALPMASLSLSLDSRGFKDLSFVI